MIGNITGAAMGFWDVFSDGWSKADGILGKAGAFIKGLAGGLMGIVRIWGQLVEKIGAITGLWDKIGGIGISNSFDYMFKRGNYAEKEKEEPVNDVIVTSTGRVIKPSKQDSIMAFKEQGPLADMFGSLGSAAAPLLGNPFAGMGAMLGLGGGTPTSSGAQGTGATTIKFDKGSVVVKIGEQELKNVIIQTLKDPEVANAISGFGN